MQPSSPMFDEAVIDSDLNEMRNDAAAFEGETDVEDLRRRMLPDSEEDDANADIQAAASDEMSDKDAPEAGAQAKAKAPAKTAAQPELDEDGNPIEPAEPSEGDETEAETEWIPISVELRDGSEMFFATPDELVDAAEAAKNRAKWTRDLSIQAQRQAEDRKAMYRDAARIEQFQGFLDAVENNPKLKKIAGLVVAGFDLNDSTIQHILGDPPQEEEPPQIIEDRYGNPTLNPKFLEYRDRKLQSSIMERLGVRDAAARGAQALPGGQTGLQPQQNRGYQEPQAQFERANVQAPQVTPTIIEANMHLANEGAKLIEQEYGVQMSKMTQDELDRIVPALTSALGSMGIDHYTTIVKPEDWRKAYVMAFPDEVARSKAAMKARERVAKAQPPSVNVRRPQNAAQGGGDLTRNGNPRSFATLLDEAELRSR